MDDLSRWLGEQLDEDERIARAATPGPWEQAPERVGFLASAEYWYVVDCSGTATARENAEHVAEWDPARVLREIDAKRQLIADYVESEQALSSAPDMWDVGRVEGLRIALRLLALPYADRPGYREEWRP